MAQLPSTGSGAIATGGSVAAGAGGVAFAVGGNVEGDIIIGDNNFKVNTNYGTIIYKQATPQARLRDAAPRPPRAPRGFVGRADELAELGRMIAASEAVMLFGPDGAGKSALLRQVANGDAARAMPNGVMMLEGVDERGEALGLEDVIQRLFDALFESDPPLKVNFTTARTYLSNTRPLVTLDGLNLPATSLARLPDLFPQGALLIAANRAPTGDALQPLKVGPLRRDESIQLLAMRATLTLDDATRPTLDTICALLADVPLAIVIAANAIRENNLAPDRARTVLASAEPKASDGMQAGIERAWALVKSSLSDNEQQMLAMAANAPGASIDPEWMRQVMSNADWVDAAMDRLQALGLLSANSPRRRVDPGLRALLRAGMDEVAYRDRMTAYMQAVLPGRMTDWEFCADELGNILGAIEWAAARRNWAQVIQLSRAIDPYLTLHGLWDTWRAVLNRVLQAARESGDRANAAWALHQLGTHAIGIEQTDQAIDLLRQALDLRQSLGDPIGMAYTRHNLDLLIPPAPPSRGEPETQPRPPSGMSTAIKALVGVVAVTAVAIGGLLLANRPSATGPAPRPTDTLPAASAPATATLAPTATPIQIQGQIAFFSTRDNPDIYQLYLISPDGSNLIHVKTDIAGFNPILSPDGRRVIFATFGEGYPNFHAINVDGSGQVLLTDFETFGDPVWSPNSERFVFAALRFSEDLGPESNVFVMRTDGSGLTQLTAPNSDYLNTDPAWSPDSSRIAFIRRTKGDAGGIGIGVVNADGSGETDLFMPDIALSVDGRLSWSPDGKRLAFQGGEFSDTAFAGRVPGIYVINADGSGLTQLTKLGGFLYGLAWSPDGAHIAFIDGNTLFIIGADGSQLTRLASRLLRDPDASCPGSVPSLAWLPDGKRIAYVTDRDGNAEIYVVNVDGTGEINLTNNPAYDAFILPGGC